MMIVFYNFIKQFFKEEVKMKQLKFVLVLLLALSLIPFFAFAGGSKEKAEKGMEKGTAETTAEKAPEEITLRILWENWGDVFTKYLDDDWTKKYEKDHPGIKLEWLFPASWQEKEIATLAGGEMTFDVFYMRPSFLPSIVERGGLIPLNDYFEKSGIKKSDFVDATIRTCMVGDAIYSIPGGADFIAWFYNKDMLRNAGYDPDNPNIKSTKDVEEVNQKIAKWDENGKLVQCGYMPIDIYQLVNWGYMFGGEWYDPDTKKVTGNDPANVKALEWLVKLVDYYGYEDLLELRGTYAEWSGSSPDHPFMLGIAAFHPNGWWNDEVIEEYSPDLDYGVMNFPTLTGDPKERSRWVVMGWSVGIPKGAPHPDEAWEFLKYSWYDQTAEFGALTINSPSVKASFSRFEQLIAERYGPDHKLTKYMPLFDEIGKFATKSFPTTPAGEYFDTELERAMEAAMSHQLTAQEALDQFTERVQVQIDRSIKK